MGRGEANFREATWRTGVWTTERYTGMGTESDLLTKAGGCIPAPVARRRGASTTREMSIWDPIPDPWGDMTHWETFIMRTTQVREADLMNPTFSTQQSSSI